VTQGGDRQAKGDAAKPWQLGEETLPRRVTPEWIAEILAAGHWDILRTHPTAPPPASRRHPATGPAFEGVSVSFTPEMVALLLLRHGELEFDGGIQTWAIASTMRPTLVAIT